MGERLATTHGRRLSKRRSMEISEIRRTVTEVQNKGTGRKADFEPQVIKVRRF